MAFTTEQNVTISNIGWFKVNFTVPAVGSPDAQSGGLDVEIVMSDGSSRYRAFNLLARLQDDPAGQTHLANLISLRDYIRTRLDNEVLP